MSESALFGPLFGADAVVAATGDQAWVRALCDAEAALARACARVGLIELATALQIGAAADEVAHTDPGELGRRAVAGGNPVIPLVVSLRQRVTNLAGTQAASAVHLGATSQDILDTALMLLAHRSLDLIRNYLNAAADSVAELAAAHRDTPMAARTLLQQALPTTFGALAAVWGTGLDRAAARLVAVRDALPVQFGGAAGTLAALHPNGLAVLSAFADETGLAEPDGVWHTDRGVIAELAGVLGQAGVAIGKVATDIVLLAQTELGEVSEAAGGGSSAMPQKQNPVAAITARAAAAQIPGFVATLLASGSHEFQRAAGAWHAEWPALAGLLRATGGAAARLRDSTNGLVVDAAAMRRTLDVSGGLMAAERVTGALSASLGRLVAHEAVAAAAKQVGPQLSFLAALQSDPRVASVDVDLAALLDPLDNLGHAQDLVDRYLERRSA